VAIHISEQSTGPARRLFAGVKRRYDGSWVKELARRLNALDFGSWIILFGASLLLTVLPLVILLGSLANERIDDDLSRHIGLNRQGTAIIEGLFRKTPTHSVEPIVLGLLIAFAGSVAVAKSLQVIYERAFDQELHGWRDFPRLVIWIAVLFGVLIAEGSYDKPIRAAAGVVVRDVVSFLVVTVFFAWTMHFLLNGRVAWRLVVRPAVATALFWLGLALFSSVYFSSAIISEHRLYGTIGVIFVLLTWFIAMGAVLVLGAACGAEWQARRERRALSADAGEGSRPEGG
jgi:membrane protein